jgi:predicted Ser/Thr protein kinase
MSPDSPEPDSPEQDSPEGARPRQPPAPPGQQEASDSGEHFAGAKDNFGLMPRAKIISQRVDPLLGIDLGGVTIVRLLGEGGMGRVYEAEQANPPRTVAVKVVRQGITSERTMRRFEREAEFLGRLQHPCIAQIFVVGSYASDIGDVPFFVMEYIPNAKPITNFAADANLSLEDRLRLFRRVCEAVSHGHDRGIVHRDLKPGNILIDSTGSPKIIDFGVARSTDSDFTLTSMKTDTGQLVGTVQYMSPEQFGDGPEDLDGRADVYSLGVVLYELVARVLPYEVRKKKMHEAARIVCEQKPPPLRSVDRAIPQAVSVIAQRCLEKDRRDRYQSAGAIASDIQRFLDGRPISTTVPGWLARVHRLTGKRAAGASLVTLTMLAALAVAVLVGRTLRSPPTAGQGQGTAKEPRLQQPLAGNAAEPSPRSPPADDVEPGPSPVRPSGRVEAWIVGSWGGELLGQEWILQFSRDGSFTEYFGGRVIESGKWLPQAGGVIKVQPDLGGRMTCRLVAGMLEVERKDSSGLFDNTDVFRRLEDPVGAPAVPGEAVPPE